MEGENFESLNHYQFVSPRTLKTITKFLVSVSLMFSFICYSKHSSWGSFLLHSFKFNLSAIPLHTLDTRWIFLICNGILVVLVYTSHDLVCSPSGFDPTQDFMMHDEIEVETLHSQEEMKDEPASEQEEVLAQETTAEEHTENAVPEEEEEEENDEENEEKEEGQGDNLSLIVLDHEEQEEGGEAEEILKYCILEDDDDDHHQNEENEKVCETDFLWEKEVQVEEEMEKMSVEELNKKFEDFIRKMKEEIRIEAQQRLVLVN